MDDKIIKAHQWIIDASQRDRKFWIEVSAGVMFVGSATHAALAADAMYYLIGAMNCGIGLSYLVLSKNEGFLDAIGSMKMLRVAWMLLVAWDTILMLLYCWYIGSVPARMMCGYMTDVGLFSIHYFCACKPPEPKRKTKTVFGFGG